MMHSSSQNIESIMQCFRKLPGYEPGHRNLSGISGESGFRLLKSLSNLEEKEKQPVMKKLKQLSTDVDSSKRQNPYSKEGGSEEFFYLPRKILHVESQENKASTGNEMNPEGSGSPTIDQKMDFSDVSVILQIRGDNFDIFRVSSAITIYCTLLSMKAAKKEYPFKHLHDEEQKIIDEEINYINAEDEKVWNLLKQDARLMMVIGSKWLQLESANVAPALGHFNRYYQLLDRFQGVFSNEELIKEILYNEECSNAFLEFFKNLPLVNERVFMNLCDILNIVNIRQNEQVNFRSVLDCYQKLTDRFEHNENIAKCSMYYLIETGKKLAEASRQTADKGKQDSEKWFKETIRLVRDKYYSNPSFYNIVYNLMMDGLGRLNDPNINAEESSTYIKYWVAFSLKDNAYLDSLLQSYAYFNDDAKNFLVTTMEKFISARFKKGNVSSEDIEFLVKILKDSAYSVNILEKLASHLNVHLELLGLDNQQKGSIRQALQVYNQRKKVSTYSDWLLKSNNINEGILTQLCNQGDLIKGFVFVELQNRAKHSEELMVRANTATQALIEKFSYEIIIARLGDIVATDELSPIAGVTILKVFQKFKEQHKETIYMDLLPNVLSLIQRDAWNNDHVWQSLQKFLEIGKSWPEELIQQLRIIPFEVLQNAANDSPKIAEKAKRLELIQ